MSLLTSWFDGDLVTYNLSFHPPPSKHVQSLVAQLLDEKGYLVHQFVVMGDAFRQVIDRNEAFFDAIGTFELSESQYDRIRRWKVSVKAED